MDRIVLAGSLFGLAGFVAGYCLGNFDGYGSAFYALALLVEGLPLQ